MSAGALAVALMLGGAAAAAAQPSGASIYAERCASCHDASSATRAPSPDVLRTRSVQTILAALSPGCVMAPQGQQLSQAEKEAVAAHLASPAPAASTTAGKETAPAASAAAADPAIGRCPSPAPPLVATSGPAWNGWGNDVSNGRFQPAAAAGLTAQTVPQLKLKWAFAFPGATSATSQPAVVGGRVFVGSEAGGVWSLDLKTGCTHWRFNTDGGVRTALTVVAVGTPARHAVFFGDLRAQVYAVDAQSGELIWKFKADPHPFARITGAPTFTGGKLVVAVSSVEEAPAANPKYPCCTFRGSVVVLDAASGKKLWQTYMIAEEPKVYGKNSIGTPLSKPAGVAIWSSPTIDVAKNMIYVGTGNAYTQPAAPMSDSLVALDLDSGAIRWHNQITPNDAFLVGCKAGNENCPEDMGPDHDFGSSPILRTVGGRRVLLLGQKSGVIYGLDPDNNGKVLWQQRVGKGSELGGIEWGPAADTANVYVAVSDVIAQGMGASEQPGGLHALRISDGQRLWHTPAPALDCTGGPACSGAQSAAVSTIPGVVFSGSVDGHLRAFGAGDGKIIWQFNTIRDYETVNGVRGSGGSLDGPGAVVVGGMVLTNSGYGRWRGKAGNVLLAFGLE